MRHLFGSLQDLREPPALCQIFSGVFSHSDLECALIQRNKPVERQLVILWFPVIHKGNLGISAVAACIASKLTCRYRSREPWRAWSVKRRATSLTAAALKTLEAAPWRRLWKVKLRLERPCEPFFSRINPGSMPARVTMLLNSVESPFLPPPERFARLGKTKPLGS